MLPVWPAGGHARGMTLPILLHGLAQRQRGFLTRAQALELGLSRRDLDRLIAKKLLRQVWRGVLSLLPEPETASACNLDRARGIAIAYDDQLLISHASAILAHGLPTYGCDLSRSTLIRMNKGDPVTGDQVRVVRAHAPLPHVEVDGAHVVTEAVAIAQLACTVGIEAAVISGDAALHRQSVTPADLDAAVNLFARCRGHRRALAAVPRMDGRAESPGESLVRLIAADAGIELLPQVEIRDARGRFVARVDFLVAGTKRVVEFDGKVKYASSDDLFAEKRREDEVRALGHDVVRLVWADLKDPASVVMRLTGEA